VIQPDYWPGIIPVSIAFPANAFAAERSGWSFVQTGTKPMARHSSELRCSRIELVARRQERLSQGYPNFHIYAGSQLVGRIYQTHYTGLSQGWFWGINGLTVDLSIGAVMHGYAAGFSEAKTKLRAAFNSWVEWAEAVRKDDLKYSSVAAQLKAMDVA